MFHTEQAFTLPKGYVDENGVLHREGVMRLARAADEILPLADLRVEKNPAYLLVLLLSRVIVRLGTVRQVTPKTIEDLFSEDLAYLQALFNEINGIGAQRIGAKCPKCQHEFSLEPAPVGELSATP
jgi:Zn finger protein HypA/HybF involved in hydrogenase expression